MDVVLQIFKRSIYSGAPLFKSIAKKPSTTINYLFKRPNKYSILEDEVRATTQQVLVTSRLAINDSARSSKAMSQQRQWVEGKADKQQSNQANLILLKILYEKFLPMIRELSDFRWPEPIKMDPTKKDQSKKCAYRKDHDHTTEQCRSLHYLVEKLIRVRHLK